MAHFLECQTYNIFGNLATKSKYKNSSIITKLQ